MVLPSFFRNDPARSIQQRVTAVDDLRGHGETGCGEVFSRSNDSWARRFTTARVASSAGKRDSMRVLAVNNQHEGFCRYLEAPSDLLQDSRFDQNLQPAKLRH